MSSPVQPNPNYHDLFTLWAALVGGLLSIIGGFLAVSIRSRIDKKAEIVYIKIGLSDELDEICTIVDKLIETCSATHIIPNSYLNNLNDNNTAYGYHKLKLFLINDAKLRKEITSFYKELSEIILDSRNKVGKLGESANDDHDKIAEKFVAIKAKTESVRTKISKYKYKPYWLF